MKEASDKELTFALAITGPVGARKSRVQVRSAASTRSEPANTFNRRTNRYFESILPCLKNAITEALRNRGRYRSPRNGHDSPRALARMPGFVRTPGNRTSLFVHSG